VFLTKKTGVLGGLVLVVTALTQFADLSEIPGRLRNSWVGFKDPNQPQLMFTYYISHCIPIPIDKFDTKMLIEKHSGFNDEQWADYIKDAIRHYNAISYELLKYCNTFIYATAINNGNVAVSDAFIRFPENGIGYVTDEDNKQEGDSRLNQKRYILGSIPPKTYKRVYYWSKAEQSKFAPYNIDVETGNAGEVPATYRPFYQEPLLTEKYLWKGEFHNWFYAAPTNFLIGVIVGLAMAPFLFSIGNELDKLHRRFFPPRPQAPHPPVETDNSETKADS
jgi:hypothetical protein